MPTVSQKYRKAYIEEAMYEVLQILSTPFLGFASLSLAEGRRWEG